ncbi:hypothetical protein [Sphingomonas gilva]|uniref:hypothetical protein n=1 Tax=Sphingomonas gilva TaxID=2305907 RepID=UPI001FE9AFD5|nr:hypothetical protein [Sphingomonas gilva]
MASIIPIKAAHSSGERKSLRMNNSIIASGGRTTPGVAPSLSRAIRAVSAMPIAQAPLLHSMPDICHRNDRIAQAI